MRVTIGTKVIEAADALYVKGLPVPVVVRSGVEVTIGPRVIVAATLEDAENLMDALDEILGERL